MNHLAALQYELEGYITTTLYSTFWVAVVLFSVVGLCTLPGFLRRKTQQSTDKPMNSSPSTVLDQPTKSSIIRTGRLHNGRSTEVFSEVEDISVKGKYTITVRTTHGATHIYLGGREFFTMTTTGARHTEHGWVECYKRARVRILSCGATIHDTTLDQVYCGHIGSGYVRGTTPSENELVEIYTGSSLTLLIEAT